MNYYDPIRRYGDTDFITGLRAIAATLVVFIHTGAFADFGQLGLNITESGKYGVQMFFVISGYTIARTFLAARSYRQYILRRLFRILPLYYLLNALVVVLVLSSIIPSGYFADLYYGDISLYNVLMHVFALSFLDYRIAASFIGVEWTIPVEIFWYVLLPLIMLKIRSIRGLWVGIFLLLVLAGLTRAVLGYFGPSVAAHWFPTTYGPYFLLGVIAHALRRAGRPGERIYQHASFFGGLVLLAIGISMAFDGASAVIGLATFLIILGHRNVGAMARTFLDSRIFLVVGSISYGIYLWHFILVRVSQEYAPNLTGFGLFVVIYTSTLTLSWVTYVTVERPTNLLGRRVSGS